MAQKRLSLGSFVRLLCASLVLGIVGGGIGSAFSLLVGLITDLRLSQGWLLCFLPVCGLTIVFLYKKLRLEGQSTNSVLKSAYGETQVPPLLTIGIFVSSVISHLFGASVGREGAALQIGGSLSSLAAKIFHIDKTGQEILIRAGMAAVFSAVFGTPLTAFFFALEIVTVGTLHLKSAIFCFISSVSGRFIAIICGAHAERFSLLNVPEISLDTTWKVAVMTILTALLGMGFCHSLQASVKTARKAIKNPYIRIVSGGVLILLLTMVVGSQDYSGAGIHIIERIFSSESFHPEAFLLKLLFTCISVAAGFKGGEIVPTLFIGSTFGALLSSLLDLPVSFGAALCMVLLFCGVTNCPLASLFLGLELFNGVGIVYFLPAIIVCFLISGNTSLYPTQKISRWADFYSKIRN